MSKPKLPSELHPDYPKVTHYIHPSFNLPCYKPPSPDAIAAFYKAHPEFQNEGEYRFVCPFCGDENGYEDQGGYCCGEVGHCEWQHFPAEECER